ncbi:MAG: class I SAM-dependent methyltransferase [Saprospiraceae bacterium]|nr:class I SAM-dependent methyltransferase [Saprospiraceae bacterium]
MQLENNTAKSFFEKWDNNKGLAFEQTLNESSDIFQWIATRNEVEGAQGWTQLLKNRRKILDAGCGNGRVTALLRKFAPVEAVVTGIDLTASEIAKQNFEGVDNMRFFARNLREPIEGIGTFDFIYCQEVLHHTGDAKESFDNLVKILEPNGEIAIYVYKQKAPIREYTDDFVREKIKGLSYEDSMKACRQITELGKALHDLKVKIQIPQVDILGIEAGEYDLQRFIYHHFAKIFWNDEFKFEDNAVINYDWYHPQDCTRHTLDEVSTWFESNNLKIVQHCVDHYGITMRGLKS